MDNGGIDDETRERIFQEELARRSSSDPGPSSLWARFRRLGWYWQALVWLVAWPVPLVLLALYRQPGHRRPVVIGAAAAALMWIVVAVAAIAPPAAEPGDRALTAAASSNERSDSTTPATAAPTTEAPTTTAPTTTIAPTTTTPPTTVAVAARMPNVMCMNLQAAQNTIQEAGVFYSRSHDATGAERFQVIDSNWVVVGQNLAPGTPFDEYDAVLEVVKYGETTRC